MSQKMVEIENENYILKDKVTALEQIIELKEEQLQSIQNIPKDDDPERKIRKLNQKIQTLKTEKKKEQEMTLNVKDKLRKREEEIRQW